MRTTIIALLAGVVGIGIGAAGATTDTTTTTETVTVSAGERTTASARAPTESAHLISSDDRCDYLLDTDFGGEVAGHLVAEIRVRNDGGEDGRARVVATWAQLGAGDVREAKSVRVRAGQSRMVRFRRAATTGEIDAHQSAGSRCSVRIAR